jgi:hypothetical protein
MDHTYLEKSLAYPDQNSYGHRLDLDQSEAHQKCPHVLSWTCRTDPLGATIILITQGNYITGNKVRPTSIINESIYQIIYGHTEVRTVKKNIFSGQRNMATSGDEEARDTRGRGQQGLWPKEWI